jgi:hypothetical protein
MKRTACLVAAAAFVTLAGCYIPMKQPEGYSTKLEQPQFQDIPIPFKGGYEYIESESFTYIGPGTENEMRVAKIRVIGDTRLDEMVEFYKTQMERHGFKLIDEFPSQKVHKTILKFVKLDEDGEPVNEECEVEIWREDTRIFIELRLRPV